MHWTQKPENKEKVKLMTKRAANTRKRNSAMKRHPVKSPIQSLQEQVADASDLDKEVIISLLAGRCIGWLEAQAERAGLPSANVTYRVGKILQHTSRR